MSEPEKLEHPPLSKGKMKYGKTVQETSGHLFREISLTLLKAIWDEDPYGGSTVTRQARAKIMEPS